MEKTINKEDRTGETRIMNCGTKATIVDYKRYKNILIKFEDSEELIKTQYGIFKNGYITNPLSKTTFKIGYIGYGKYKAKNNNIETKEHMYWKSMMGRCYNANVQERQPRYKGCSVCEEWHNFQNFAEWFNSNWYKIEGQRMAIDKDILVKGNKIYSPDTCVLVPQCINLIFVKGDKRRGNTPIGVRQKNKSKLFEVSCSIYKNGVSEKIRLGKYDDMIKAFSVYKDFKESYIKEVAEYYKKQIPKKLYDALYRYEVEITD